VEAINASAGRVDISLPCSTNTAGVPNFGTTLPGPATMTGATGTMILEGVRIDAAALTAFPATATISLISGGGTAASCPISVTTGLPSSVTPANVLLQTSSVPVINASAPGIGSVSGGGLPSSVTTTGTTAGTTLLGTDTNCSGDALHSDCGIATIYTNRSLPIS